VSEDGTDDIGIEDEGENAHFAAATGTAQRIDLVRWSSSAQRCADGADAANAPTWPHTDENFVVIGHATSDRLAP
jgi:hypothetical protein